MNAFSADELAELIEAGLQRHDATTKLVPSPEVLAEHVQKARDEALTGLVTAELEGMVDIDAVVRQLIADHPDLADVDEDRVRETFTDQPTRSCGQRQNSLSVRTSMPLTISLTTLRAARRTSVRIDEQRRRDEPAGIRLYSNAFRLFSPGLLWVVVRNLKIGLHSLTKSSPLPRTNSSMPA